MLNRLKRFALLGAAGLALLGGCTERSDSSIEAGQMILSPVDTKFKNTDITGLEYANGFTLTDHTGKTRSLADFKGKAVFIFFGYANCPDVCPTTMAEMASVMKSLGPKAEQVQVLFVSVDPERDTADLLSKYVPAFDPRFLGLTGDKAAIDKVAKDFKLFYQKVPNKDGEGYTVDHTAGSYVFDPDGRLRLFVRHGQGPDPIAHDLKLLLEEKAA